MKERLVLLIDELAQLCPPDVEVADWQDDLGDIAEQLESICRSIDEIHKQQSQPLIVEERVPKQSQHDLFLSIALLAFLPLVLSRWLTVLGVYQATHKP